MVQPEKGWFEPLYLEMHRLLDGTAQGRGQTWFFKSGDQGFVLKHYRRGGAVARLLRDRYLWTGLERTRAWREFRLLAELSARGLPIPRPVSARIKRHGLYYTADLITYRCEGFTPLAEALASDALGTATWQAIGGTLRAFHEAGADHPDLNARNILIKEGEIIVLDWDRAVIRRPGDGQQENLARLKHSLDKLKAHSPTLHFNEADFTALQTGYALARREAKRP